MLARHRPDQVHAVLLRHVVDVAKAGVVLKIQNDLNRTSSTSLEKALLILIRVLNTGSEKKIPVQYSNHRIQCC